MRAALLAACLLLAGCSALPSEDRPLGAGESDAAPLPSPCACRELPQHWEKAMLLQDVRIPLARPRVASRASGAAALA
ncbi:hypothetical protein SAMN06265365_1426 [Tistlia consotensis]|uniref:Uncharacterized protein n=1 Tax=Tistlia consotensis USBA 355 TaxID=560819 RepID=A0A1Y6CWG3_9PROT|nr:hypothetical protein [Tistlia consotensis]SMF81971.1 hypothetical protein SAMN05428998_1456 [Tistlia consotensis USBA 355]SNS24958.1 hypothetical protein SAMN06265365_1426 [Tistlia consotensis]